MAIRERLIYAIDIVTDGANKGLSNFRSSVKEAEGATGKFKAGASSAFSSVQANAGALALGAGAALAAFGAKAVSEFQNVALAAGKFSDATGLAVDEASRWIEVAGDVGVPVEAIEGAVARMNKAIATGGAAVEEYGISLQRTSDGTADVNGTFLNAIDVIGKIEDPTKRAQAAQEVFGKSYKDMAEIVFDSADNLKTKLGEVSDAKVINEKELEKARRFRATMDDLKDAVEDATLIVGEGLVPVLSDLAELADVTIKIKTEIDDGINGVPGLGIVKDAVGDTLNPLGALSDGIRDVKDQFADADDAINDVNDAVTDFGERAPRGAAAQDKLTSAIDQTSDAGERYVESLIQWADSTEEAQAATEAKAEADEKAAVQADKHRAALDELAESMEKQRSAALDLVGGDIAVRDAQRRAAESAEELNEVLEDQETTLDQAGAAIDEAADAHLNAASAAAEYRAKQMEANGQTVDSRTKAQLLKEELQNLAGNLTGPLAAAIQGYIDQLGAIPRTVGTTIVLTRAGRVGDTDPFLRTSGARASGGPVAAGGLYEVNENGSELLHEGGKTFLMAGRNGSVEPLSGTAGAGRTGAASYTINLYGGQATPQGVVDAIKKWERLNGTGWRS
jgi:hypothetical protein